ncbi:MAG: class I SAM-dependent methyltransferase [Chloroflexi bacterium]|nr:class I SAM-dependent methyltransferase [Chloroflexota bacterium]
MTTNPPRREQPSTYFVQDRSDQEELTRVQLQGQMVTASMGGILPEQPDPTIFHRVLDIGCGTGDWLISAAKTYPSMSRLIGIDISKRMIDYARAQAEAQQVSDRVEFHVMDALLMLEFPNTYFDLVNQRFGLSWLRTWDWPKLLQECQRVTRRGGVIRITESDTFLDSGSLARTRLLEMTLDAFYRAGHFFIRERNGVTSQLAHLLRQHGIQNVQTRSYALEYRADTPEGQRFYEDIKLAYRTVIPFFRKWTRVPEDYETIYQQMLSEMQQPDFVATWNLLTAWGQAPGYYNNRMSYDIPG